MKIISLLLVSSCLLCGCPVLVQAQYPPLVSDIIQTLIGRFVTLKTELGLNNLILLPGALDPPVQIPINNTLTVPSVTDAQYYVYFSFAIYCHGSPLLTNWTCTYCRATGPNVYLNTTLYNQTTQVVGMININDVARRIIVTFRGSYAAQNFVVDFDILLVPFDGVNESVKVHAGFLYYSKSIYPRLIRHLLELHAKNPDYKIIFGGHSLGSAIAMLTCLQVVATEPIFQGKASLFELYSYGGPRVGDLAFARWANSLGFMAGRVTHYAELAPHLFPPLLGYTHFATELWNDQLTSNRTRVCASNVTEDFSCSDSFSPVYDVVEHFWYYNLSYFQCAIEDPINAALQIA